MNKQVLEAHRLRVYSCGKVANKLLSGHIAILVEEDPAVTEDQLFEKYSKLGELTEVNKIFPHVYLTFKDKQTKLAAVAEIKKEEKKVYSIRDISDFHQHLELVRDQKLYHLNHNRISVFNIPAEAKEAEVRDHFSKFGEKTRSFRFYEYAYKSYSTVLEFETTEGAKRAADEMNNTMFKDRRIRVLHNLLHVIPNYKTSVYITGMKNDTTEEQIYDDFKQYGNIDYVSRHNLKPDSALIVFKTADAVEKAIAAKVFVRKTKDTTETMTNININKLDGPISEYSFLCFT
jgi:hypothetical protein